MAVGSISLNNMSVQTRGGLNQALLMPKLQFRFRVSLSNFGDGSQDGIEITKQVMDVSRPNVSFTNIPVNVYNSVINLAGKHAWQPLNLNVRDDALGNVTHAVGAQMQKQMDMMQQASAHAAQDYKFEMDIEILDGDNGTGQPIVLEMWEIYGCYISTANYNALNYATSEVVSIGLTIQFDNAIQVKNNAAYGVGQPTFRAGRDLATGIGTTGFNNNTVF